MPNLTFFVPGTPRPGGSKSGFPFKGKDGKLHNRMVPASKYSKAWMKAVAAHARMEYQGIPIQGPVHVHFYFYLPRPKSHYRTGKFSALLRPDAPKEHIYKPDKTKLRRAAEDALSGILYADDCQITQGFTTKDWATPPDKGKAGVQITMEWEAEE